jgi:hypothetical protein
MRRDASTFALTLDLVVIETEDWRLGHGRHSSMVQLLYGEVLGECTSVIFVDAPP